MNTIFDLFVFLNNVVGGGENSTSVRSVESDQTSGQQPGYLSSG